MIAIVGIYWIWGSIYWMWGYTGFILPLFHNFVIVISFPLNILRTCILPNFVYVLMVLTRSRFGFFCNFLTELWPLIACQNFVSTQYLENQCTETDITQTCLCNILQYFMAVIMFIFR